MELQQIISKFIEIYGGNASDLRVFASPGRVNLIGEHTDYNGGFVMPAALTMKTTIVARKRTDNIINLAVTDLSDRVRASIDSLADYKHLNWGNYQIGVAHILQNDGLTIVGCDLLYDDTVPHGGGLSSSAANEVSTALLLHTFSNEANGITTPIDPIYLAKVGQRAENQYVGVNCGIMDQFASAMGKANHAIYLKCDDLSYRLVPLALDGYKIVISNTNKKHSLGSSKYNERRAQCDQALALLQTRLPQASCLGEISVVDFDANSDVLTDPIIKNRAQHVVYEDDRVIRSIAALEANELVAFGKLMIGSHESLRDLYEVSCSELDIMVEEALKIEGVLGSRMTGAGFGGCTVSIVREDAVSQFIEQVGKNYAERSGLKADFYVSEIGDGGQEIIL